MPSIGAPTALVAELAIIARALGTGGDDAALATACSLEPGGSPSSGEKGLRAAPNMRCGSAGVNGAIIRATGRGSAEVL